jgi:hypothetical protein
MARSQRLQVRLKSRCPIGRVGIILLLGEVGFSLAEQKAFLAAHPH